MTVIHELYTDEGFDLWLANNGYNGLGPYITDMMADNTPAEYITSELQALYTVYTEETAA